MGSTGDPLQPGHHGVQRRRVGQAQAPLEEVGKAGVPGTEGRGGGLGWAGCRTDGKQRRF